VTHARLRRSAWIVVLLAVVAIAYQYGMYAAREGYWHARRGWARVNGRLVDVGGYRLYITCQGSGSPAVVMDAGFETAHKTWNPVIPGIARFTRVCVYDRRGLGLSDGLTQSSTKRTSDDVVRDLRTLLKAYGVPPPYVLVGHSFGGLNVRLYAARHPEEIAGLALVDATHEDQPQRNVDTAPEGERADYLGRHTGGNLERLDMLESARQVRASRMLPPFPVLVLSAGDPDPLQNDLAGLRPDARHIAVPQSGHFIQVDAPSVLVDSLRDLTHWSARTPTEAVKR
jgi:pimeloyl-ACP methyl ester carboxylesterase